MLFRKGVLIYRKTAVLASLFNNVADLFLQNTPMAASAVLKNL